MNLTTLTVRADDLQFEVVDPGEYAAKVSSFPDIRAKRYIAVQLQILDEDKSVLTNLKVQFDIKKPRKLMHFLRAIGQSCSEDKDFNIIPATWKGKECRVRLVTTEFRKEGEELGARNVVAEFLHNV
jgi:hypothetical protein